MSQQSVEKLTRCCARHHDWPTLYEHLCKAFVALETEVCTELCRARAAIELFGLDQRDALWIAELIVRNQLLLLRGDAAETARLDPERHGPRNRERVA